MSGPVAGGGSDRWLALEAVTGGVGYASALCWASTCLVGIFRPDDLGMPYWQDVPVRTDTSGFLAFLVAGVCLVTSEYLRLRRSRDATARAGREGPRAGAGLFLLAVSKTVVTLGTGLAVYISFNAVTHPATLGIHVTHLLSWPSEGTLRVIALFLCAASVMTRRWLLAQRSEWDDGSAVAAAQVSSLTEREADRSR